MPAPLNRPPGRARVRSTALACGALALLFLVFAAGAARADFGYVGAIGAYTHDEVLNGPADVAIDAAGSLYVSDVLNHRVRKFSADGAPVADWPVPMPAGISAAGGSVHVASFDADKGTSSVKTYTPDGHLTKEIPLTDTAIDIAVDGSGNVYASLSSGQVMKMASTGALIWTYPTPRYRPRGLAINPADGNLWVTTAAAQRVEVLTPGGSVVKSFPIGGWTFGNIHIWPFGIAFGDGYAWVTDSEGDCCISPREGILKVDPGSGAVVAMYGNGSGRVGDMFDEPWGLEFSSGSAYVADHGSGRVVRWGEPVAGGWPRPGATGDPGLTVPPPTVAPADKAAPTVRLLVSKQRLRDVRRRGLIVRGNVSEAAKLTVTVRLDNRTARKLRLTRGRKAVIVARVAVKTTAGRVYVRVKLVRKAASALRRVRSVKLTVTLSATDAAGNAARSVTRAVVAR